ncbi:MAG: flippase [Bacteroidia bacterium]|nr:flippase [Bacteroidia bacterium]
MNSNFKNKLTIKLESLKSHEGFARYSKNTGWLLGEKILRIFVSLFVGVWVARYLGPDRFGLLSYSMAFVGLFAAISTLGLDGIVVRELVKDGSKQDKLIGTAFWLKLIGGFVVLAVMAFAINFTSNDSYTNLLVFIIASASVFQSFNVIDFYFQSKVLSKYVVFANIISLLLSSIVKVILIINKAPLIAFAWAVLFDSVVLAVGFVYFYFKNNLSFRKWKFEKDVAIELLRDSWPLILSSAVIAIYMRIDQVMIKEMMNNEAVGQYAAAVRISEAWYFMPMVISSSLFPAIVNAKAKSDEIYYARLQKLYDLMVWLAIAIALPMTFLSDWVVNLLYGGQYYQAGSVLIIHIWASVFVFLGVASGTWFTAENLQIFSFYRTFFGMCTNVFLNFLLIPVYGINGAAVATLISQIIAAYLYDLFNSKTRKMFYIKTKSILGLSLINRVKEW